MRYDLTARLFPLIFDRYAFSYLKDAGIHSLRRKEVRGEYRAMVERTPDLPKGNSFLGNILIGCYVLSFYKAAPDLISEEIFHGLILALCNSKPMVNGHKNEDAFDAKTTEQKEKDAETSQSSDWEMDWRYSFQKHGDSSYDITYTRCGLCQLGRRENCFHLIRYLCEADYITYSLMGAALTRNETLASGGCCCDFHITRKKEER